MNGGAHVYIVAEGYLASSSTFAAKLCGPFRTPSYVLLADRWPSSLDSLNKVFQD